MDRGDHGAVGGVERGEQAGRAVAHIIVGAFLGHARHHRECRLRPGQRLHLRLLVHAVDDGRLGRVQIQADDVVDLLHELRVGGELEPVLPVWFQLERSPDPSDRGLRQATAFGHLRPRPMGRILRCRLQRRHDDLLDPLGRDRRRSPRARLVDQTVQTIRQEPGTPLADRHCGAAQPSRDRFVVDPVRTCQHDPGPQR